MLPPLFAQLLNIYNLCIICLVQDSPFQCLALFQEEDGAQEQQYQEEQQYTQEEAAEEEPAPEAVAATGDASQDESVPREIQILETSEDIQGRREQVRVLW